MFFRLFNWLVKRGPVTLAANIVGNLWGFLSASYGALLVLKRSNPEAPGRIEIFIFTLYLVITIVVLHSLLTAGFLRLFGTRKWERKEFRIINDNILAGHFRPNLSLQTLLKIYQSLQHLHKWIFYRHVQYGLFIYFTTAFAISILSSDLTNISTMLIGGGIGIFIYVIGLDLFYESFISPLRKECKILLIKKGLSFKEIKETPFLNLKIKSKSFIFLLALTLSTILIIIRPLDISLIIFSILSLVIFGLLINLVFDSIYKFFMEIKESAKDLETGKRAIFFTGSLDKEIIDLSQSLNKASDELYKNRKKLEESKTVLEIKVKARTKELEELAQSLDDRVKEKIKEVQKRIEELERFHKLTIGREHKMIELKKEIEKLENELKDKDKVR